MQFKIANIVSVMYLVEPFTLDKLKTAHEFKKQGRTKAITITGTRQTSFAIFRTGSITGKGSKGFLQLQQDVFWLRHYLSSYDLKIGEYKITNIVSIAKISDKKLSLFELSWYIQNCSYDPTPPIAMPRAILYKPDGDSRTLLIYGSGTAVLTGFKTMIDSYKVANQTERMIAGIAKEHPNIIGK